MSEAVFPELRGLSWERTKTAIWSTQVQTAGSGIEKRASLWSYPRWKFNLAYEFLEDDGTTTGDLQRIIGFFNARRGSFESFLYYDPSDHLVQNQVIGRGDGQNTRFQLVRKYGGFIEPVRAVQGMPLITMDDDLNCDFVMDNYGLIEFWPAPPPGAVIAASFDFYYRVRFMNDESEVSNFMWNLWSLQKCEFISVKGREQIETSYHGSD